MTQTYSSRRFDPDRASDCVATHEVQPGLTLRDIRLVLLENLIARIPDPFHSILSRIDNRFNLRVIQFGKFLTSTFKTNLRIMV